MRDSHRKEQILHGLLNRHFEKKTVMKMAHFRTPKITCPELKYTKVVRLHVCMYVGYCVNRTTSAIYFFRAAFKKYFYYLLKSKNTRFKQVLKKKKTLLFYPKVLYSSYSKNSYSYFLFVLSIEIFNKSCRLFAIKYSQKPTVG